MTTLPVGTRSTLMWGKEQILQSRKVSDESPNTQRQTSNASASSGLLVLYLLFGQQRFYCASHVT